MSWKVLNKSISDEENNLVQNGKELEGMNENIIKVIESTDVAEPLKSVACCSSAVFESSVNLELISTDPSRQHSRLSTVESVVV
jgi:hypothetical protein